MKHLKFIFQYIHCVFFNVLKRYIDFQWARVKTRV